MNETIFAQVLKRMHEIVDTDRIGERRDRDGQPVCYYCGSPSCSELDHIFPKSKGGPNNGWNRAVVCSPCNNAKRAKHPIRWISNNPPNWPDVTAIDFVARMLIALWISCGEKAFWLDLVAYEIGDGLTLNNRRLLSMPIFAECWPMKNMTCSTCGGPVTGDMSGGCYIIKVRCQVCGLDSVLQAWHEEREAQ